MSAAPVYSMYDSDSRMSTASDSAPYSAIGNLLTRGSGYTSDFTDDDRNSAYVQPRQHQPQRPTPASPPRTPPRQNSQNRVRRKPSPSMYGSPTSLAYSEASTMSPTGPIRSGENTPTSRDDQVRQGNLTYVQSMEAEMGGGRGSKAGAADRDSLASDYGRPVTVVDFPTPSLGGETPPASPYRQVLNYGQADDGYGRSYASDPQTPTYPSASHPGLLAPYSPHMPDQRPHSPGSQQHLYTQPSHAQQNGDIRSPTPQRPIVRIPSPADSNVSHSKPFPLPPPQSPISPMLAAPPGTYPSPSRSPLSSNDSPSSTGHGGPLPSNGPFAAAHLHDARGRSPSGFASDSDSVRGFDIMHEKRALFREGEEEIVNPLSATMGAPRRRREEVLRGRERMRKGMTTVDFWKRFSVMKFEGADNDKESEWLQHAKSDRSCIKKGIYIGLGATVVAVVAVVVVVILLTNQHK